jgi:hypothetical protein
MFTYWSKASQGSEKVPKILKYIHRIAFVEDLPTASIDLIKGDLKIGVRFFLDQVEGPEDLLFILIHERNHWILRRLYPEALDEMDYPPGLLNFAEDAYVNGIGRRQIPSTLPERFYHRPEELLLTGRHSQVDWGFFQIGAGSLNPLEKAHAGLYRGNRALLKELGETPVSGVSMPGYSRWMDLVLSWYREAQARGEEVRETNPGPGEGEPAPVSEKGGNQAKDRGKETPASPPPNPETKANEPKPNRSQGDSPGTGEEKEGPPSPGSPLSDGTPDQGETEPSQTVSGDDKASPEEGGWPSLDQFLESYIPLVENTPRPEGTEAQMSLGGTGLRRVPIPPLTPDDPVVGLILNTSDLPEFRDQVEIFDGASFVGIEGVIKGILSDRATEKIYAGYSVPVPPVLTRRDLLTLAGGNIPPVWGRDWGVQGPNLHLYVDVSGSMTRWYGYIPYIYQALRHLGGRVFQFSTRVVEVDPEALYLETTGGTSFDAVAKHLLEEEVRGAILITDGIGVLSASFIGPLRERLETLVYIKTEDNPKRNWEVLATEVLALKGGKG